MRTGTTCALLKLLLAAMTLVSLTVLLPGCETIHGLGSDIEGLGRWIQEKSE